MKCRSVLSCLLVLIMALNVAVPLVRLAQDASCYSCMEFGEEDVDGKDKKETEKEKESISESVLLHKLPVVQANRHERSPFADAGYPVTEQFTTLPELPPEA